MKHLFQYLSLFSLFLCFATLTNTQYLGAATNDLTAMNYALTLENLEAAFYIQGLTKFNVSDFVRAGYGNETYLYFTMIMHHEMAHVKFLKSVVSGLKGTPAPPCNYNFSIPNVTSFVSLAQIFENVGVMAYDGAISSITLGSLQTAAATIASVEARHASYLNQLTNKIPFPSPFDNATLPSIIASIIAPHLTNCSYTIQLPTLPPTSNNTIISKDYNSTSNDILALNYALTLENLEYTYYNMGMAKFNQSTFAASGYNATVFYYFTLIAQHEQAHVNTISAAVGALGGKAVQPCAYNFTVAMTNVSTFVSYAQVFENVGVRAYDGAISTISNGMIQTIAATIATVEARHAAYLNKLVGVSPFPADFDNATDPTTIVALVGAYLNSCSGPALELPVIPQYRQNYTSPSTVVPAQPSGNTSSPNPASSSTPSTPTPSSPSNPSTPSSPSSPSTPSSPSNPSTPSSPSSPSTPSSPSSALTHGPIFSAIIALVAVICI